MKIDVDPPKKQRSLLVGGVPGFSGYNHVMSSSDRLEAMVTIPRSCCMDSKQDVVWWEMIPGT